jgi:hypothetical protein
MGYSYTWWYWYQKAVISQKQYDITKYSRDNYALFFNAGSYHADISVKSYPKNY